MNRTGGKSSCLTSVIFLPTWATWSGERTRFLGLFQGCTGLTIRADRGCSRYGVVVVVVFFTLTDRASTIHSSNIRGCQSGAWTQRGTKVNVPHHGDNPLLRPIGIQIATKSMRLYKQWHRPHREQPRSTRIFKENHNASRPSEHCCRLPTTSVLSNKAGKLRPNQF